MLYPLGDNFLKFRSSYTRNVSQDTIIGCLLTLTALLSMCSEGFPQLPKLQIPSTALEFVCDPHESSGFSYFYILFKKEKSILYCLNVCMTPKFICRNLTFRQYR